VQVPAERALHTAAVLEEGGDVELTVVADLCEAFADLATSDPAAAVFTARKLSRWMRAQAKRAA
jgi:hypothetical protein